MLPDGRNPKLWWETGFGVRSGLPGETDSALLNNPGVEEPRAVDVPCCSSTDGACRMLPPLLDRRAFLRTGAAASIALFAPTIIPATALGRDGRAAPSERVVLAAVGSGGKGQDNLAEFIGMPDVQVVAVCDVDRKHADAGVALVNKHYDNSDCTRAADFRPLMADKAIDAVCISTPDHWHALISIAAIRAGKDVYCEKPLANSIAESRAICDVAETSDCIVQVGTHQRSDPRVRYARELVRRGCLGDLTSIRIQMPTDQAHHDHVRKSLAAPPPEPIPDGFDYNFWLGHTPPAPYTAGRCHFWWRFNLNYGGGELSDSGSHLFDITQLVADRDHTGPVQFKANGQKNASGIYDAYMSYDFVNTYRDGLQIVGECKGPRGVRFEGTAGSLFIPVPGGKLEAAPKSLLETKIDGFDPEPADAPSHPRNFIDCVKSRSAPVSGVAAAHRSATIGHLNNIAMILDRELEWDPQREQFEHDDEANDLLSPTMRDPWML